MISSNPVRRTTRHAPSILFVCSLIAIVGIAVVMRYQSQARSSVEPAPLRTEQSDSQITRSPPDGSRGQVVGASDGVVPDDVTVFDDEYPAVANLAPELLRALRGAATDAAAAGIEFNVNSGWRTAAYQEELLDEAIATYGSAEEAARWVASPNTSAHVSGDAVDLGPTDAAAWLAANGPAYGLCPTYSNEPWHFELRPDAAEYGCPPPYLDATYDPRSFR